MAVLAVLALWGEADWPFTPLALELADERLFA